jgi:RNA polymerase sigma-70 factor, ECF subfamily
MMMENNQVEFQEVYDTFQPKILRYLVRLVGELEAEDLTQEVFVKVSQALESFRRESTLSTWIYRIATNAALDRLRSPSFQKKLADDSIENAAENAEDMDVWTGELAPLVEQQLFRKEMNDCIQGFIMKLPENYRTVLALVEAEGLSNKEVAEILGVSVGTVKIRIHRARERLKEELIANCDSYWVEGNEYVPELKKSPRKIRERQ